MKLLLFLNILFLSSNNVSAKAQHDKPFLNAARKQLSNQPAVEKLRPYLKDSGSGSEDLVGSGSEDLVADTDFQDVIAKLRDSYMRSLDTLMFDNCCQPKFLGVDGLSPPIFPMRGGSSSLRYAKCDMSTEGGGWMVILRRTIRANINFIGFYRNYMHGFGKLLKRDYWMGLLHMHHFTSQPGGTELRVELMLNGTKYVAHYDDFFVDSKTVSFTLRVGGYRKDKSNISDSLSSSSGFNFTTVETDRFRPEVFQQTYEYTGYCTILYGAWWHGTSGNETCTLVALTKGKEDYVLYSNFFLLPKPLLLVPKSYIWVVNGQKIGFDSIEMKIRPKTWECGAKGYAYTDQVIRLAFLSHHHPNFNPFNMD